MNRILKSYYSLNNYKKIKLFFKNKYSTQKFKILIKKLYGINVIFTKQTSNYFMKYRQYNNHIFISTENINRKFTVDTYDEKSKIELDEILSSIEHEFAHKLVWKNKKLNYKNRYDSLVTDEIDETYSLHPVFRFSEILSLSREMFIELFNANNIADEITWTTLCKTTDGEMLNDFIETYPPFDNETEVFYNQRKNQYITAVQHNIQQYNLTKKIKQSIIFLV